MRLRSSFSAVLLSAAILLISGPAGADPPTKSAEAEPDWEAIGAVTGVLKDFTSDRLSDPAKLASDLQRESANRGGVPQEMFNRGIAALLQLAERNNMVKPDPAVVSPPADGGPAPVVLNPTAPERYYRAVAQQTPNAPSVHVELGKYSYERRDYGAALSDYENAIKLDPSNEKAWLGYGHSANELGDYKLASMAAKQLLGRDPANKDALGLYHFATGRAPKVSLQSALFHGGEAGAAGGGDAAGLAPRFAGAAPGAAPGSAPGGYAPPSRTPEQVAAQARAQAAAAGPDAAHRSVSITKDAMSALKVKDYPTAHQLASRAIVLDASNVQALNYRAYASARLRRYSDAVADANTALALAPNNAAVLQTRSWAFSKMGNYQDGLKDAEASLALNASRVVSSQGYQNKALALAGLKDRAGALEALKRSAALDPRFQNQYERALQLPDEEDMTLLFDDQYATAAAASAPPPPQTRKRFARLALLSGMGGLLIALAILHVVSASWREKVHMTIRRVLAPSDAVGSEEAAEAAAPASNPGAAFWLQYELIKEIGLGGMGVVYEAQDRSLERRVAVKKMRDEIRIDPHERRRFVNEAKLVAQLRHPNIVDIYAIVEEGQEVYLVFEFVSGRTLHDQIKSDGPMTLEAARGVLHAASEAVEHAHAAQIVHRDLKPSNIMITDDGRIKVMDFGVARQAKDAITKMSMTNTVVGTPPYMAPEQEQGTVRRESDVYALGVCLYEMLTGHLPFTGGGAAMLLNKLNGKHIPPSQRNPALPAALDEVIAKALIPDPEKRYHTPTELVAALDAVIASRA